MQEGADTRTLGYIYVAIVQTILLFGLETWVVNPRIKRVLGGFHHRVAHRILGKMPWQWTGEACNYHILGDAMREAGLE